MDKLPYKEKSNEIILASGDTVTLQDVEIIAPGAGLVIHTDKSFSHARPGECKAVLAMLRKESERYRETLARLYYDTDVVTV